MQTRLGIEKAIEDKRCYAEILKALSPACLNKGDANEEDIQKAYEIIAPDQDRKDFFAAYGELVTMSCLHNSGSSKTLSLYDILSLSLANEEWKSVSLAIAIECW